MSFLRDFFEESQGESALLEKYQLLLTKSGRCPPPIIIFLRQVYLLLNVDKTKNARAATALHYTLLSRKFPGPYTFMQSMVV